MSAQVSYQPMTGHELFKYFKSIRLPLCEWICIGCGQFSSLPQLLPPSIVFLRGSLSGRHFKSSHVSRHPDMRSAYQALVGYLMNEALFFTMALIELQMTRRIVFAKSVQLYSCFREREFADLFFLYT